MFSGTRIGFAVLAGWFHPKSKAIPKLQFPDIGDSSKLYNVTLTEPEINAIHATAGFLTSFCGYADPTGWWKHYGPTLTILSERLAVFDD